MAGSFSLVQKLAVAGAFCAIVALAIGTEDDPGVIVTGQSDAEQAVSHVEPDKQQSSNYWSLSGDAAEESGVTLPPPRVPEEKPPPGFGATPSPDLPK